jgi:nucleotide-binding universal stress UspA family protein
MFEKVLFPTDLGELSSHLLTCISDLRNIGLEEAILLYVINVDEINHNLLASFRDQDEARLREIARIRLEEQIQVLRNRGIQTKAIITTGIPSYEIVRIAESEGVSLIIGGAQRHHGKEEDELDITTTRVIYKSNLPVLVIKLSDEEIKHPNECDRFCSRLFSKVLFPTDWSDCAKATLNQLMKLRKIIGQLIVSHVMDERILRHLEPEKIEGYRQNDLNRLHEVKEILSRQGFSVNTHLHVGYPPFEVSRIADEEDISLMAIGKRGRTGLKEIIWGSISQHLVRLSYCSVLVYYCCD